jgi:hypothetical protein
MVSQSDRVLLALPLFISLQLGEELKSAKSAKTVAGPTTNVCKATTHVFDFDLNILFG